MENEEKRLSLEIDLLERMFVAYTKCRKVLLLCSESKIWLLS